MAATYYLQDTDALLGCSISAGTVVVVIEDPDPVPYDEEESLESVEISGFMRCLAHPDPGRLCANKPTRSQPQLDCGDEVIEVSSAPATRSLKFGTTESGWTFKFQTYVGGTWQSPTDNCPFPSSTTTTVQWRIRAQAGSFTLYFDPYMKSSSSCMEEPPSDSTGGS
ncbi:hypothetical protein [Paraliomyxa miuraensis]|uniref:hypothetical protein n=1 Tax=Paraliomyxa miuraensis TaxID=376150 RepID=UPI00224E2575|nr:hypothetical protein [Paraliomyxa miuraensis]MCX4244544.1 hypothetical protein [Paraliomyxa miuraensis]